MTDKINKFRTKQGREIVIANYKNLLNDPGWQMIEEGLEDNIKLVTDQILVGGEKEVMDGLRQKVQAYKDVLNAPKEMIEKLQDAKGTEVNPDPFD